MLLDLHIAVLIPTIEKRSGYLQKQLRAWGIAFLIGMLLIIAPAFADIAVNSHQVRPGGTAIFTINITNTGETPLNPVKVIDTLPKGMSYVTDDRNPRGQSEGNKVIWPNVGALGIGDSTYIHVITKVDRNTAGRLNNTVSITGTPVPEGYNVTDLDEEYIDVMAPKARLNKELISIGDQNAVAFGSGRSTNNIRII